MIHSSFKESISSCIKYFIILGAIFYLVATQKVSLESLWIRPNTLHFLMTGVICLLLGLLLSFLRYYLLIKTFQNDIRMWAVFRICFIGNFFNSFMLGGVGGDIVKIAYLFQHTNSMAASFSSAVADRVLGLAGLISLGCFAILTGLNEIMANRQLYILLFLTVGTLIVSFICFFVSIVAMNLGRKKSLKCWTGIFLIIICMSWLFKDNFMVMSIVERIALPFAIQNRLALTILFCGIGVGSLACILILPSCLPGRRLDRFIRCRIPLIGEKVMSMIQSPLVYRHHLDMLGWAYFISIFSWILLIASLYFFSCTLPLTHHPSLSQIFYTSPIPFLANIIPLPGGGIGVGETAFEYALNLCRISGGQTISGGASIFLMWRFWFIISSFIGLPLYLKSKFDLKMAMQYFNSKFKIGVDTASGIVSK